MTEALNGQRDPPVGGKTLVEPVPWLRQNWILLLFCIPVFRIVFLSSADGEFTDFQFAARILFLPALFVEMGVIITALISGMGLAKSVTQIPAFARWMLLGWVIILFAPLFWPEAEPSLAIRASLFWTVHILFLAATSWLLKTQRPDVVFNENALLTLPLSAAIAGVAIVLFIFFTGLDSEFSWNEDIPGYNNLRHVGYIFAPAIALSLAHLAAWPDRRAGLHLVLLALNVALMLWLGSRGPVLGLVIGFGLCFFFFAPLRQLRFWIRSVTATCIGAVASVLLPIPDSPDFGAIQRFWSKGLDNKVTSGRGELWADAVQMIGERPLFGHGAHQYQLASEKALGMFKHPHQSILQSLFDWGIVGGGLFAGLCGLLAYKAYVASSCRLSTKLVSAAIVSTLAGFSLVDGVFFYPYTIALAIVFLIWPIAEGGMKAA